MKKLASVIALLLTVHGAIPAFCEEEKPDFNQQYKQMLEMNEFNSALFELEEKEQYEAALALCDQQLLKLSSYPSTKVFGLDSSVLLYIRRGDFHRKLSRYEEAQQDYLAALKKMPESGITYARLGAILSKLGKVEEAKKANDEAVRLDPKLGHTYIEIFNLEPRDASQAKRLTELWLQTNIEIGAVDSYKAYLKYPIPNDEKARVLQKLGDIYWKKGKRKYAINNFAAYIKVRQIAQPSTITSVKPIPSSAGLLVKAPVKPGLVTVAAPVYQLAPLTETQKKQAEDLLVRFDLLTRLNSRYERALQKSKSADLNCEVIHKQISEKDIEADRVCKLSRDEAIRKNRAQREALRLELDQLREYARAPRFTLQRSEEIQAKLQLNSLKSQQLTDDYNREIEYAERLQRSITDKSYFQTATVLSERCTANSKCCITYFDLITAQIAWKMNWNVFCARATDSKQTLDQYNEDNFKFLLKVIDKLASMIEFGAQKVKVSAEEKTLLITASNEFANTLPTLADSAEKCGNLFEEFLETYPQANDKFPRNDLLVESKSKLLALKTALDSAIQQLSRSNIE